MTILLLPSSRALAPFAAAAALLLAGCAGPSPRPLAQVPATLQPPAGQALVAVVPAVGVQVYECRAKANAATEFEWAFVAPEADLLDAGGRKIGTHYAGPHWEALDGSRVQASVRQRADAPSAEAIPWLQLEARPAGPAGRFSPVATILRVNTVGGMAPRGGCDRAAAGSKARVNYSADYYFYARKAST